MTNFLTKLYKLTPGLEGSTVESVLQSLLNLEQRGT